MMSSARISIMARRLSATSTSIASATTTPVRRASSAAAAAKSSGNNKNNAPAFKDMSDEQLMVEIEAGRLAQHQLEKHMDASRSVDIRRKHVDASLAGEGHKDGGNVLQNLPFTAFDTDAFYKSIEGTNCECVIGYVPVPVGVVGPLILDNQPFRIPMATTEGALVASTNRGCRAIAQAGGAYTVITKNGMTRAPLLRVGSIGEAAAIKAWVENPLHQEELKAAFNSTTRFGKVRDISVRMAGRNVYVRFACNCGDAMGMNMVTKGSVAALQVLVKQFPNAEVVSLSGNVCSDKKAAAVNWIEGRGRSVSAEVVLPGHVITRTLKTSVDKIIEVNLNKNLVGSAIAGSIGGFNAHASNIVAAIFLATGNDIAQNVESSNCITLVERAGDGIHMSVTMPSVEVGTVGGGTSLPAQKAALAMIGCAGANKEQPGLNADTLARAVAGTVLAGELSLLAALASGHLLESHMRLNRKKEDAPSAASHGSSSSSPAAPTVRTFSTFGHPSSGGPRVMPMPVTGLYAAPRAAGEHAARVTPSTEITASDIDLYGEDFTAKFPVP
eukprot:m.141524 g.141524  ORF g.141524 m.141524 type:complete len:557 (-) comp16697_c0_seq1:1472-3142(-)